VAFSGLSPGCAWLHGGSMTDNRWELGFVVVVAAIVFFAVWHIVAPLIG
jgi:hypothetical protein